MAKVLTPRRDHTYATHTPVSSLASACCIFFCALRHDAIFVSALHVGSSRPSCMLSLLHVVSPVASTRNPQSAPIIQVCQRLVNLPTLHVSRICHSHGAPLWVLYSFLHAHIRGHPAGSCPAIVPVTWLCIHETYLDAGRLDMVACPRIPPHAVHTALCGGSPACMLQRLPRLCVLLPGVVLTGWTINSCCCLVCSSDGRSTVVPQ